MKNVVIIGAGPAGLTAALELLRRSKDYSVTILEADNTTGGISRTVKVNDSRMDLGGHRFYTKSARVLSFWESLMPCQGKAAKDEILTGTEPVLKEGGADPETTEAVMLSRRRVSSIYQKGKFYDYPVSIKTLRTMGFSAVPAFMSYLCAKIKPIKEDSLEAFYINRFGKRLYRTFFESYTEKVWGINPSEMSPDWGTQRVKGLSLWKAAKDMFSGGKSSETSLIKRFLYPKLGPGQLWQCAADEITALGGKIIFDSPAERIKVSEGKVKSVFSNDVEYPADILVSSMPLAKLIEKIDGEVPEDVRKISSALNFRDFITVGVEVKKLKLRNRTKLKTPGNIPPDCWIYIQDPGVKMGRLQIFNNWSPYMVSDPEKSIFLGTEYFCSKGDELSSKSDSEIISLAIDELAAIGVIEKTDVVLSHCERMNKAYPSYDGAYSELHRIKEYINSVENLFCTGRNGQHRYNNMDHSMLTAMKSVDVILGQGLKSEIWNVNTEPEYGE